MVETDPVRIIVELVDQVSDDLKKIEARMEKLGAKVIDPEFEVDEDGELTRLQTRMKMLERRMTADWHIDIAEGDVAKVAALRRMAGKNINAAFGGTVRAPGGMLPNIGVFDGLPSRRRNLRNAVDNLNNQFRRLGRTLSSATPSIMDWWQVVALLIPVMITLGAAVVGVVAALGGMATAAAAIVGVGLIGWGDSASESMMNLRQEFQRLKTEMFAALQPAATEFAPITQRWVRGAPEQVARLNDELQRLVIFQEGLAAAGSGLVGWTEDVLAVIADMEQMIVQVALRIGQALGTFLIDLLSFGLKELYRNQEAYIKLAETFVDIIAILFNLSKAITFALAQFRPFFEVAVAITGILGNRFVTAILTLSIALTGLVLLLGNVMAMMMGITSMGMLSWAASMVESIYAIAGALQTLWVELTLVQKAFAGLLATTGLGLALWGVGAALQTTAGPSPGAAGRRAASGGTTVNDITIQGDVGNKEMHRLLDHLETKG